MNEGRERKTKEGRKEFSPLFPFTGSRCSRQAKEKRKEIKEEKKKN